jgi:gamma-glutamyltranspeptidase/glutathione hydrolase
VKFKLISAMWLMALASTDSLSGQPPSSTLATSGAAHAIPQAVQARRGLVVSVSQPASLVGAAVLRQGGNAVDAAVATAFALAVTYPPAGNIGGGGFMLILPRTGAQPACVEYRETAPAAARVEMFAPNETRLSAKAVGTPGTVRGLALAHSRYGRRPWPELLEPAVRLARDGFAVDASLAQSLNEVLFDEASREFVELKRVFAPPGERWQAGDRLIQPDLARTLAMLAEQGADSFYQGPVAAAIVAEMTEGGGIITEEDLHGYAAHWRQPIQGTYRGFDIFGPPPPSAGGIVLVQTLNMLEPFDLRREGPASPANCHRLVESLRRAFLDRARYLGDPDFVAIPAMLTTKEYATACAQSIDLHRCTPSDQLAPDIPLSPEGDSTTHFSIVDADGMAVSNTYTLEQSFGSRVVVRGFGFLLNNEMGDFNSRPGHTDRRGEIGTQPNLIEPGKRMLSSQTPVLVLRDGRPYLLTGSPGGRTIISTVVCVVLNVLEYEMDLPAAVAAPRWHHQWLPDQTRFEGSSDPAWEQVVSDLTAKGHLFRSPPAAQGDAHSIFVDPQTGIMYGVADMRLSGFAAAAD